MTDESRRRLTLGLLLAASGAGCEARRSGAAVAPGAGPEAAAGATGDATGREGQAPAYTAVKVEHELGTTVVESLPQRTVALDMNEVDFLDQLGVAVVGMPKDFVPHFLARYRDDANVLDLGAIVQPNLERVHAARPDLILITSLQASHYRELSRIAPTIQFDVDYRNSQAGHLDIVKGHLLTLGQIYDKSALARQKVAALEARVAEARQIIDGRPEGALVVLHNNGAFSAFGPRSRYGFIFEALGVRPASAEAETGLHGRPVSSEFIQTVNPDIVYVIDRTAVMERRPVMTAGQMANPLLRQTRAWQNGRVVFADPDAWYVTAASVTSLAIVIDDVLKGYRD